MRDLKLYDYLYCSFTRYINIGCDTEIVFFSHTGCSSLICEVVVIMRIKTHVVKGGFLPHLSVEIYQIQFGRYPTMLHSPYDTMVKKNGLNFVGEGNTGDLVPDK